MGENSYLKICEIEPPTKPPITDQQRTNHLPFTHQHRDHLPDSKHVLCSIILKNLRYNLIRFYTLILEVYFSLQ